MRISPEVFVSASWIARMMRSCSSLLRNSFVRILSPARPGPASAKTTAPTAKATEAAATRRPAAAGSARPTTNERAAKSGISVPTFTRKAGHDEKDDRDEEKEQKRKWELSARGPRSFAHSFPRTFVLSADRFDDGIDPSGESAFVIVCSEAWFDLIFSDIEAGCIRQRAFQAIADLDVHLMVLNEHE